MRRRAARYLWAITFAAALSVTYALYKALVATKVCSQPPCGVGGALSTLLTNTGRLVYLICGLRRGWYTSARAGGASPSTEALLPRRRVPEGTWLTCLVTAPANYGQQADSERSLMALAWDWCVDPSSPRRGAA